MAHLAIVKLGGSALTDKSRYRVARAEAISRLAREVASFDGRLALVHGAGSFGHIVARDHALAQGVATPEQRRAFAQVHADVRELHGMVLAALREAGAPAVGLSTFDLARLMSGELRSFSSEPVQAALDAGFLPVLHGDAVLDSARGGGILSGDVLMLELARALRPKLAVFATDVDGIYDKDPGEPGATLQARLGLEGVHGAARDASAAASEPRFAAGPSRGADITGGMAGKLERARAVARAGVPVQVVNGMVPGRVADALARKPVVGTTVA